MSHNVPPAYVILLPSRIGARGPGSFFISAREAADVSVLKACPRCGKLIPHGQSYCETCAPVAAAERQANHDRRAEYLARKYNRRYNAKRAKDDPKYRQFRNSKAWRDMSRSKLQACGYKCEAKLPGCHRIACEVHHVEPIKTPEGWDKRFDWDNLMGVCTACHNVLDGKTGGKRKKKDDPAVLDMREILRNQTGKPVDPGGG